MTADAELIEAASNGAIEPIVNELLQLADFREARFKHSAPLIGGNPVMSQVFRVWILGDSGTPSTAVLKLPAKNPKHRNLQAISGSYAREVYVYRMLNDLRGKFQPHVWSYVYAQDAKTSALLVEDLGNLPKRNEFSTQIMDEIMLNLARIHSRFWEDNQLRSEWWMRNEPHADIFNEDTDQFAPNWEKLATSKDLHPYDQPYVNQVGGFMSENLLDVLTELDSRPRTLTHGDLHTENMMLRRSDGIMQPVLIDWQDAVFSGASSDVAKFLSTTLPPDDAATRFHAHIAKYHRCLSTEIQADYPFDRFQRDIMIGLLGTFANYVIAASTEPSPNQRSSAINNSLKRVSAVINVVRALASL